MRLVLLGALLAALLVAADVNGKWKGSFEGGDTTRELTFDITAEGSRVTGTVSGLLPKPLEIKDGKLEGGTVSFWVMSEWQDQPIKLVYKGTVEADQIRFTMGTEDGAWSTDFNAKRVK